eukprot:MONOS_2478.1-p1 / transcript=MONOS_2478.1 / gene=MONOS_2478 / organism=Monocercomonoides_exilis_PA203 / gene_product=unspecified product / transcript_product=unspecified product / location=Mono_scaffold00051:114481-116846(-) / protein_length=769 / sequence_SO=supercontig / SO=protein_coding / is_pseudo=false
MKNYFSKRKNEVMNFASSLNSLKFHEIISLSNTCVDSISSSLCEIQAFLAIRKTNTKKFSISSVRRDDDTHHIQHKLDAVTFIGSVERNISEDDDIKQIQSSNSLLQQSIPLFTQSSVFREDESSSTSKASIYNRSSSSELFTPIWPTPQINNFKKNEDKTADSKFKQFPLLTSLALKKSSKKTPYKQLKIRTLLREVPKDKAQSTEEIINLPNLRLESIFCSSVDEKLSKLIDVTEQHSEHSDNSHCTQQGESLQIKQPVHLPKSPLICLEDGTKSFSDSLLEGNEKESDFTHITLRPDKNTEKEELSMQQISRRKLPIWNKEDNISTKTLVSKALTQEPNLEDEKSPTTANQTNRKDTPSIRKFKSQRKREELQKKRMRKRREREAKEASRLKEVQQQESLLYGSFFTKQLIPKLSDSFQNEAKPAKAKRKRVEELPFFTKEESQHVCTQWINLSIKHSKRKEDEKERIEWYLDNIPRRIHKYVADEMELKNPSSQKSENDIHLTPLLTVTHDMPNDTEQTSSPNSPRLPDSPQNTSTTSTPSSPHESHKSHESHTPTSTPQETSDNAQSHQPAAAKAKHGDISDPSLSSVSFLDFGEEPDDQREEWGPEDTIRLMEAERERRKRKERRAKKLSRSAQNQQQNEDELFLSPFQSVSEETAKVHLFNEEYLRGAAEAYLSAVTTENDEQLFPYGDEQSESEEDFEEESKSESEDKEKKISGEDSKEFSLFNYEEEKEEREALTNNLISDLVQPPGLSSPDKEKTNEF